MGLHDRTYWKEDQGGGYGGGGGGVARSFLGGLPRPTRIIKYLLIINGVAFVCQFLLARLNPELHLGVTLDGWWQPWR